MKYYINQITLVSGVKSEIINYLNEGTSKIKETFKFFFEKIKNKIYFRKTEFLKILINGQMIII